MKVSETLVSAKVGLKIHLGKESRGYTDVSVQYQDDEIFHGGVHDFVVFAQELFNMAQTALKFSKVEVPTL